MIFSRLRQVLPGLLLLSAITATAQANVILDGAHLLQQDGSGTYGGSIWSTTGCCASAVLGVGTTPGSATNINTGNGDLNYTLLNGITHFVLSGQTGYSVPHLGVDLFFNETAGGSLPQITAFDGGVASGNQRSYDYFSTIAPGGALAATFGVQTVTLSNYSFTSSTGNVPIYASFDLTLRGSSSTVPEPGTWLLAAGALGVIIKLRWSPALLANRN